MAGHRIDAGSFHTLAFLSRFTNQRLIELPSSTTVFRHARLGNDLLFWSHAAKFVLELLAGQHFLPGLFPDKSGRFWAAWQPFLLEGSLRERLEFLVAAMPRFVERTNWKRWTKRRRPVRFLNISLAFSLTGRSAIGPLEMAGQNGRGQYPEAVPSPNSRQRPSVASSGSMWMDGLSGEEPLLQLPPQPAHQLYKRWIDWMEQLHSSVADSNFQVAFSLELQPDVLGFSPPGGEHGDASPTPVTLNTWHLHFYLQDKDDPDLLIPAHKVWNENGQSIRIEGRRFDQPQERLLTGLGIASRLFTPIRESLRAPRPERRF